VRRRKTSSSIRERRSPARGGPPHSRGGFLPRDRIQAIVGIDLNGSGRQKGMNRAEKLRYEKREETEHSFGGKKGGGDSCLELRKQLEGKETGRPVL